MTTRYLTNSTSTIMIRSIQQRKYTHVSFLGQRLRLACSPRCDVQRRRRYSTTTQRSNQHAQDLLDHLRASGTLGVDLGSVHMEAKSIDYEKIGSYGNGDNSDTKILHLQRHGQGYHNLLFYVLRDAGAGIANVYDTDPMKNPFVRPEIVDAPLTEQGKLECEALRERASTLRPELILVSPLRRAIQSAQLTFGDFRDKVPLVAHEACREELGLLVCNKRRRLSSTKLEFPLVDFSIMDKMGADEEDTLWSPHHREHPTDQAKRIYGFFTEFVRQRPEKEIAIVGHSAWFYIALNAAIDCSNDDHLKSWFRTSELRTLELTFTDKS